MTHNGQNRPVQLEKLNILLTPSEEGETSPSKQRRSSRGESNSTFTVHPLTWYRGGDVNDEQWWWRLGQQAWWSAFQMRWAMYPLFQLSPTWVQIKDGLGLNYKKNILFVCLLLLFLLLLWHCRSWQSHKRANLPIGTFLPWVSTELLDWTISLRNKYNPS